MSKLLEEKIDRLILGGAVVTNRGRLDFPDRLPVCLDRGCKSTECVFKLLRIYLECSERLFNENHVGIGKCKLAKLKGLPYLCDPIDLYCESYYKDTILPVILKLYDKNYVEELFEIALER